VTRVLPPTDDIQRRRPVWTALADLFLDTELQEADLRHIARVLVASGYTDAEVEEILCGEVFPVCIWNMRSVAGVWAGFDSDWLQERILANAGRVWKKWRVFHPGRWMIREEWEKVVAYVRELRAGADVQNRPE
jgi:hypothetical protein